MLCAERAGAAARQEAQEPETSRQTGGGSLGEPGWRFKIRKP
jgi:hypothetical protein